MNFNYSFLDDPQARLEIRKHQWLESEKQGCPIGFATAALDWIDKYGQLWKQTQKMAGKKDFFSEQRSYRRFNYKIPVQIQINDRQITTVTDDLNLLGLSCRIPTAVSENTKTEVAIHFRPTELPTLKSNFSFTSYVKKARKRTSDSFYEGHQIFLPFTEEVRDYLRMYANQLSDSKVSFSN